MFLEIFVFIYSMFTPLFQFLESTLQIFMKTLIVSHLWQCVYFLEHFRCLAERAGDVAFVKDVTVLENTNGKQSVSLSCLSIQICSWEVIITFSRLWINYLQNSLLNYATWYVCECHTDFETIFPPPPTHTYIPAIHSSKCLPGFV